MNSKTKTYVLLAAVLVVWGIIGFRILDVLNPEPKIIAKADSFEMFKPQSQDKEVRFEISLMDRDPFLGKSYVKSKPKPSVRKKQVKETFIWPTITYHGVISNSSSEALFIVTINGVQQILKKGQSYQDILIKKASKEAIQVVFKNRKKSIQKT